jgi:hypothetical protein
VGRERETKNPWKLHQQENRKNSSFESSFRYIERS